MKSIWLLAEDLHDQDLTAGIDDFGGFLKKGHAKNGVA